MTRRLLAIRFEVDDDSIDEDDLYDAGDRIVAMTDPTWHPAIDSLTLASITVERGGLG